MVTINLLMYCVLMVFRCAPYRFISAGCSLIPLSYRQLAVNMWQDQDKAAHAIHMRAARQASLHFDISRTGLVALM